MLVAHITPALPPVICGIGDYATVVGARMEALRPEVRCGYVAAGHRAREASAGGALKRVLAVREPAALWGAIRELVDECAPRDSQLTAVVLHYSGYGYESGGAPTWLADAVERRPAWARDCRLATFFHELYATGRPWQRAFWTSGRQRNVAIRMARASDAVLTNRQQSARWLEEHAGLAAGSVPSLPICSNVGEPATLAPWDERPQRAVTFGGTAFKRFALFDKADVVAAALERLGITELIDIGASTPIASAEYERRGIRVASKGRLPATDVSEWLSGSRLGLLDYNPDYLDKSGIYAAYAAHGVCCMIPSLHSDIPQESVFATLAGGISEQAVRCVAISAAGAYRARCSAAHAEMIMRALGNRQFIDGEAVAESPLPSGV